MQLTYIVVYGGGLGPNVWDAELIVEAETIREALDKAETIINGEGVIFLIEQDGLDG